MSAVLTVSFVSSLSERVPIMVLRLSTLFCVAPMRHVFGPTLVRNPLLIRRKDAGPRAVRSATILDLVMSALRLIHLTLVLRVYVLLSMGLPVTICVLKLRRRTLVM